MSSMLRGLSLAATLALALCSTPAAFAQDAMATDAMATEAMAPAMTPLTDDEFKLCMEQAGAITFPAAQYAAASACQGLHAGMDVMGAIERVMAPDAMAPADAMAPTDAMAPADAMAPGDAMAPATK
jgi:hypothetical protein